MNKMSKDNFYCYNDSSIDQYSVLNRGKICKGRSNTVGTERNNKSKEKNDHRSESCHYVLFVLSHCSVTILVDGDVDI